MSKLNELGKLELKDGRKVIAKIYNRPVFHKDNGVRWNESYPINLVLPRMGVSRECETLQEADKYLYSYTGLHIPTDEMPIPEIEFTRVASDYNGNPRYVCHYLNFIKDTDKGGAFGAGLYELAVSRARKLGGRKYHTKSYGGGIVFQYYGDLKRLSEVIHEMMKGL